MECIAVQEWKRKAEGEVVSYCGFTAMVMISYVRQFTERRDVEMMNTAAWLDDHSRSRVQRG